MKRTLGFIFVLILLMNILQGCAATATGYYEGPSGESKGKTVGVKVP